MRRRLRDAVRNDHAATVIILAQQWLQDHRNDLEAIHDYAEMLYKMARYEEAI